MNAEASTVVPKKLAATISRASPAIRESAVANAKIAVLTLSRRRGGSAISRGLADASADGSAR